MCVCVRERERESGREGERGRERVCGCAFGSVRECAAVKVNESEINHFNLKPFKLKAISFVRVIYHKVVPVLNLWQCR